MQSLFITTNNNSDWTDWMIVFSDPEMIDFLFLSLSKSYALRKHCCTIPSIVINSFSQLKAPKWLKQACNTLPRSKFEHFPWFKINLSLCFSVNSFLFFPEIHLKDESGSNSCGRIRFRRKSNFRQNAVRKRRKFLLYSKTETKKNVNSSSIFFSDTFAKNIELLKFGYLQ